MWQEAYSDGAGDFTYAAGQWDAGWTVGVTDFNGDGHADILVSNALRRLDPGGEHGHRKLQPTPRGTGGPGRRCSRRASGDRVAR